MDGIRLDTRRVPIGTARQRFTSIGNVTVSRRRANRTPSLPRKLLCNPINAASAIPDSAHDNNTAITAAPLTTASNASVIVLVSRIPRPASTLASALGKPAPARTQHSQLPSRIPRPVQPRPSASVSSNTCSSKVPTPSTQPATSVRRIRPTAASPTKLRLGAKELTATKITNTTQYTRTAMTTTTTIARTRTRLSTGLSSTTHVYRSRTIGRGSQAPFTTTTKVVRVKSSLRSAICRPKAAVRRVRFKLPGAVGVIPTRACLKLAHDEPEWPPRLRRVTFSIPGEEEEEEEEEGEEEMELELEEEEEEEAEPKWPPRHSCVMFSIHEEEEEEDEPEWPPRHPRVLFTIPEEEEEEEEEDDDDI